MSRDIDDEPTPIKVFCVLCGSFIINNVAELSMTPLKPGVFIIHFYELQFIIVGFEYFSYHFSNIQKKPRKLTIIIWKIYLF